MKSLGKKQLTLNLKEPLADLPADLWGEPLELSSDGLRLTYTFDAAGEASGIAGLMRRLGEAGVDFTDMATRESSLEDIFVSLVSTRA